MIEKVGEFSVKVVKALNLDIIAGTAIYIGESNIKHMKEQHPGDYKKFYTRLQRIIETPDYVGINKSDNSIEMVKNFGVHVKLAVRIANDGEYYARSLYEVGKSRVENSIKRGQLKPLTNI
ncbi:MAG: PBECR2 nuclease fold domain-containing protein [Oscillospiraceae bacterium]|nr:PBECR2 nuclease fold domain-containing protein [Oscillospiraceae bacterium]